jgi:hypothetical protein
MQWGPKNLFGVFLGDGVREKSEQRPELPGRLGLTKAGGNVVGDGVHLVLGAETHESQRVVEDTGSWDLVRNSLRNPSASRNAMNRNFHNPPPTRNFLAILEDMGVLAWVHKLKYRTKRGN